MKDIKEINPDDDNYYWDEELDESYYEYGMWDKPKIEFNE